MKVRNLIAGLALGAALPTLAAAQTTTSTTTTLPTTTTTTLPAACLVEASFASLECRVDALGPRIQGATDLGRTKTTLTQQVTKLSGKLRDADQQLAAGNTRQAKTRLKKAERVLIAIGFRLRSLTGRKQIGSATRSELQNTITGLDNDLRTLRRTL